MHWNTRDATIFVLEVKLFDVWGIDFMGPFPPSNDHTYILVDLDSKWDETISCATNDATTVTKFLQKNIFTRFGMLGALLVMKVHILLTVSFQNYYSNIMCIIGWRLHTTLKLIARQRFPTKS